jgi:hypothetical protein
MPLRAIRPQASSRLIRFTCAMGGDGAAIRSAKYNGTEYVVAPVVIFIADTVIHPVNSPCPELVTARALRVAPGGWNNRPITMDHPHIGDDYTSANDPGVLERFAFGVVFNARYHNDRVVAEAWLDPARAGTVGPDAVDVIERLRAGKMVETSGCAFTVAEQRQGTHAGTGKQYGAVWVEITPDHLAMLPRGTEGACSVDMGCGMPRAARAKVKSSTSGRSDSDIRDMLTEAINLIEGVDYSYAEAVYETSVVYYMKGQYWERDYSIDGNEVTLGKTAKEVKREVDFVPDTGAVIVSSALSKARRPSFKGTSTSSWSVPSLGAQLKSVGSDASTIATASAGDLAKVSARSLLGDASADNARDLMLFTVVGTDGKLYKNALLAVRGGRGSQAKIPDAAKSSAQSMAASLLKSEFNMDVKANSGKIKRATAEYVSTVARLAAAAGTGGEEDAEAIQYDTISKMLDSAGASVESAKTLIASLLAMGADAEEEVEDACLESVRSMCMQATSSLYSVASACMDALNDNDVDSGAATPVVIVGDTRYNAGARHNAADQKNVQAVHDMAVKLGADCEGSTVDSGAKAQNKDGSGADVKSNCAKCAAQSTEVTEGEDETMSDKKKDLIGQLIASKDHPSPFTEEDRKTLESFSEEKLTALVGTVQAATRVTAAEYLAAAKGSEGGGSGIDPTATTTTTTAAAAAASSTAAGAKAAKTPDEIEAEYLARPDVPQSIKDTMAERKVLKAAQKARLVASLAATGVLTKEALDAKPVEVLEELARFAKVALPKDYSGQGGPAPDSLDTAPAVRKVPDSLEEGRKLRAARQATMNGAKA